MAASIFVGADINSLYKKDYTFKKVTKYNVNTGEPIIKEIIDTTIETVKNIPLEALKELGLNIFSNYYENKFLGIYITSDICNQEIYCLEVSDLTEIINKVKTLFKKVNLELPVKIVFSTEFQYYY